jgi:DNA-binding transcriptional ArsR family regulator
MSSPSHPATPAVPDYDLAPSVAADRPAQWKALADPTRSAILHLVLERAATTTELATALGRPKGSVDHHLKVLERAGLVRVVRTRQVRAVTERFWGRTARTIQIAMPPGAGEGRSFIQQALDDGAARARPAHPDEVAFTTLRHARLAPERLAEFVRRLDELAVEFASAPRGGARVHGLLLALYPTDRPTLPEPAGEPGDDAPVEAR